MIRFLEGISRFAAGLRWLFMPAGLFALLAVGIHQGALVVGDGLLALLDWLDGGFDAMATAFLGWLGSGLGRAPAQVDGWIEWATGLVDLPDRAAMARWSALGLELWADLAVALPALGYREKDAPPPRSRRPFAVRDLGVRELARRALRDPTALTVLLPLATAGAALSGACRIASEVEAHLYSAASFAPPALAGALARFGALFALGGVLVSLGGRAILQAAWHARARAEGDLRSGSRPSARRLRGALRLAPALPLALGAGLFASPWLSFFR